MKRKVLLAVGAVLFCLGFMAVKEVAVDRTATSKPLHFIKGFFIGAENAKTPINDQRNKITDHRVGCVDWDFPALGSTASGIAGADTLCSASATFTLDGGRPGDWCNVAPNFGMDGGTIPMLTSTLFKCRIVGPNMAQIDACNFTTDAGTLNLADAGYCAFTWSNNQL